ncbi:MAG: hypothetical protein WC379_05665 [Methanoregula sp.]|jgi:hypothetical protein
MKLIRNILIPIGVAILGFIALCSILLVKGIIIKKFFLYECGVFMSLILLGYFLALLLILFLTGYISAYLTRYQRLKGPDRDVIRAGIYSAILAGLSLSVITRTTHIIDIQLRSLPELIQVYTIPNPLSIFPLILLILFLGFPMIILSAGLGWVGANRFLRVDNPQSDISKEMPEEQPNKKSNSQKTMLLCCLGILLCIGVPQCLNLLAIVAGFDDGYCDYFIPGPHSTIVTSRPDVSSINLMLIENYSGDESQAFRARLAPPQIPMQISIDGKDLSNQSVIRQQGLSDTITPPEGIIRYMNETTVLLTGPDIAQNGSAGRHVIVTSHYYPFFPVIILDTYV